MKRFSNGVLLAALCAVSLASLARGATVVLPRAGQVGFGIDGGYGSLLNTGELGQEFGTGPHLTVHLRYRLRYERAIGLVFENQQLDARRSGFPNGAFIGAVSASDSLLTRDRVNLVKAGFEVYQMFDTRTKTTKYLGAGLGLVQVSAQLSDGETQYPIAGDGVFLSASSGVEHFFYRSWAYDAGVRYEAIFHDGKVNHDLQAELGLIIYAAY